MRGAGGGVARAAYPACTLTAPAGEHHVLLGADADHRTTKDAQVLPAPEEPQGKRLDRFIIRRRRKRAHDGAPPPLRQGSAALLLGFLLILFGGKLGAFVGILVEGYGFVLLFAGFIPTVLIFLKRIPKLDKVLDSSIFKTAINRVAPMGGLPL